MILKQEQTIYFERFSLKNANKSCNKGLKNFIKPKKLWKKIILQDNIATKYIEYKHKTSGTSSCKSICISRLRCFNSSTKYWKTVSLKFSFGLSVEIWSWLSS